MTRELDESDVRSMTVEPEALGPLPDEEPVPLDALVGRADLEEIRAHVAEVFRAHGHQLLAVAARQRRGSPDDLVQDAIVKVLESPQKVAHLDERQTFGFMRRVIENRARDEGKKDARRKQDIVDPEILEHHVASGGPGPEGVALSLTRVVELLRALPRVQATCLMSSMGGWDMRRTAERIGITHEDARYQLRQARKTMRRIVGDPRLPVLLPPALVAPAGANPGFLVQHLEWAIDPVQAAARIVRRTVGGLWPDEFKGRAVRVAFLALGLSLGAFAFSFSSLYSYVRHGVPEPTAQTRVIVVPGLFSGLEPARPAAASTRSHSRKHPGGAKAHTLRQRPRRVPTIRRSASATRRQSPRTATIRVLNVASVSHTQASMPVPRTSSPPPIAAPQSRYSREAARCATGPDC